MKYVSDQNSNNFQNFLLGTFFQNGGIAILLSALTALYQMTFAGFFLHLDSIPPVLRWLQWLCPLKYCLEALSVNEVASGLQIVDVLEGVPVSVSAVTIMSLVRSFIRVKMNIKLINVELPFLYSSLHLRWATIIGIS